MTPAREFRLEDFFTGDMAFHTAEYVQSPHITHTVNLGFAFAHHAQSHDATALRPKISNIDGESVRMDFYKDTRTILRTLGARKISQTRIGDIKITHAFAPRIPTFITKDGARVNVQIAHRANRTTVGWPVILGSF